LPGFRIGTKPLPRCSASAVPKMNPRDSMPHTRSKVFGSTLEGQPVDRLPSEPCGFESRGVMVLEQDALLGKSGTSRM
jgi:hypothetical protein